MRFFVSAVSFGASACPFGAVLGAPALVAAPAATSTAGGAPMGAAFFDVPANVVAAAATSALGMAATSPYCVHASRAGVVLWRGRTSSTVAADDAAAPAAHVAAGTAPAATIATTASNSSNHGPVSRRNATRLSAATRGFFHHQLRKPFGI